MPSDEGTEKFLRAWSDRIEYVNFSPDEAMKLVERLKKEYPGKYGRVFKTEILFKVEKEIGWDLATLAVYSVGEEGEWDDFAADLQSKNFLLNEEVRFYNMVYYDALAEEQFRRILRRLSRDDDWVNGHLF
jgi:ABC-type nitrate/sulfonate/bicarbonate transport system substrate-binding protein